MRVAEREIFLSTFDFSAYLKDVYWTLFELVIARMLWAFNMEEIPGQPIDLKEYDGLSGRSPVPFCIKMIPRHEKVVEVLEKA